MIFYLEYFDALHGDMSFDMWKVGEVGSRGVTKVELKKFWKIWHEKLTSLFKG